ncbi:MAG: restriction endonuclease subunit S, partial [Lachnospiraceae bacterium]
LVPAGSIIVSNRAPIGLIAIADHSLCTSQGCKSLVKKTDIINEKFVFYFLTTQEKELNSLGRGTTFFELSSFDLANFKIPVPAIEIQNKIVGYLDRNITEIDRLIKSFEEQAEQFEVYKRDLISNSVTKGIKKNVSMKDSGVDWMGEVPEHWNVTKMKWMFEIVKRIYGAEDRDVLSITQRGIKIKDIDSNDGQLAESYANYQVVNVNDFAMNSMDLLTGGVDCSPYEGVTSPDYRVFRFHPDKPQCHTYYKYMFQMCYTNRIFYRLGQGVSNLGRWRLQADQFLNIRLPEPPIEEQEQIASYLDTKVGQIEKLTSDIKAQIGKLKEYRKIVIHDAVTGKIKVTEGE